MFLKFSDMLSSIFQPQSLHWPFFEGDFNGIDVCLLFHIAHTRLDFTADMTVRSPDLQGFSKVMSIIPYAL